ncbi:hypothetical protein C6501_01555 [Candidatus Poribacteria bacterium]|nr:MAG: hypothetical protein C6501_01555 [Candidatus Poribacteria bacterium]
MNYKRNVMAGMRWTLEWVSAAEKPNREFLFLLKKINAGLTHSPLIRGVGGLKSPYFNDIQ